jgi:hypothetical protein
MPLVAFHHVSYEIEGKAILSHINLASGSGRDSRSSGPEPVGKEHGAEADQWAARFSVAAPTHDGSRGFDYTPSF